MTRQTVIADRSGVVLVLRGERGFAGANTACGRWLRRYCIGGRVSLPSHEGVDCARCVRRSNEAAEQGSWDRLRARVT